MFDKELRKDVKKYLRLKKKKFSVKNYVRMDALSYKAEKILNMYAEDKYQPHPKYMKDMALYIQTFANGHDEQILLDKLQSQAKFQVNEYLSKKTLKEKIKLGFSRLKNFFSSSTKNKPLPKKEKPQSQHSHTFTSVKAASLALLVAVGGFLTFSTPSKISKERKAKQSVERVNAYNQKVKELNRTIAFNDSLKQLSQTQTQAQAQAQTQAQTQKKDTVAWVDVAIKTTDKKNTVKTAATQTQTVNTQKKIADKQKATASTVHQNQPQQATADYQQIWKNYYDNTIEILSSKQKKEELYKQIDTQLQKGIFKLPQNVSKERLAYTYLIYKAYGMESSLNQALFSTQKLTSAQQQQMATDVNNAGEKGNGVKQMAQAKSKTGKLSSHSHYDKASNQLKKQHVKNLKQLRQMRKAQSRAH